MCLTIDPNVKSLNKRTVWKVFDKGGLSTGKIVSLYQGATYPKGKLIERSRGLTNDGNGNGIHGLHFYLNKTLAKQKASFWAGAYIAKFAVNPKDFLFASNDGEAMYERATRIGNFIKVRRV